MSREADARLMCRGPFSLPVSVGGSTTAPDGRERRGLLRVPERVMDDGTGQILERAEILRVPAADVLTVNRGTSILVDGVAREVREKLPTGDGAVVILELARA